LLRKLDLLDNVGILKTTFDHLKMNLKIAKNLSLIVDLL
jgi:hypothetical protein